MIKEIEEDGNGVLDRSIFGDRIFADLQYETGIMNKYEYDIYNNMYYSMVQNVKKPDMLVYIDCDLDTAVKRINKRGREMELNVDMNYWSTLNSLYTRWYSNYNISKKMSIDANSYHPDNKDDIKKIYNRILEYGKA